jgi:DNA modification methylase
MAAYSHDHNRSANQCLFEDPPNTGIKKCIYESAVDPQHSTPHVHVVCSPALEFLSNLKDNSVSLFVLDPPYYGIVNDEWDNQWDDVGEYVNWMCNLLQEARRKLTMGGSVLLFGGVGKHREHPFWELCMTAEKFLVYRNMITWKKRRAYGKSHDYLFCREEIAWFSKSAEREEVTFNVPLLKEKRGYAGFDPKYPAKSEYKRVSNVWDDIPELMRPERSCEKPQELYDRIIETHSNENDLVCDFFLGTGRSACSALENNRRFLGCDKDPRAVEMAKRNVQSKRDQIQEFLKALA